MRNSYNQINYIVSFNMFYRVYIYLYNSLIYFLLCNSSVQLLNNYGNISKWNYLDKAVHTFPRQKYLNQWVGMEYLITLHWLKLFI